MIKENEEMKKQENQQKNNNACVMTPSEEVFAHISEMSKFCQRQFTR